MARCLFCSITLLLGLASASCFRSQASMEIVGDWMVGNPGEASVSDAPSVDRPAGDFADNPGDAAHPGDGPLLADRGDAGKAIDAQGPTVDRTPPKPDTGPPWPPATCGTKVGDTACNFSLPDCSSGALTTLYQFHHHAQWKKGVFLAMLAFD